MKAYKATDKDMKCLGYQFEMNKEFIHDGELCQCKRGFHFCKKLKNIFKYYYFLPKNRFWEVEIPDDATVIDSDDKSVTNKIKFIRELSLNEIKKLTHGEVYLDTDGGWMCEGYKSFYNEDGLRHRVDGPAIIFADGRQAWYQNGKLHRVDGPARICADGIQEWWLDGKLHREDGPAIIGANGRQAWYQNGKLHRVDGPAIIYGDDRQEWYRNGLRHRKDDYK